MKLHMMKPLGQFCLALIVILGFPLASFGNSGGHKILSLEFVANTSGVVRDVMNPKTGNIIVMDALCFDGVIKNIATGKVVGTARDCLSPQELDDGDTPMMVLDDSIRLIGTTIFRLRGGTIISQGETTVRPRFVDLVSSPPAPNTHITGSSPAPGSNSVLAGTKRFRNASGTVRLSGAVDMSGFTAETGAGPIVFSCLFVITLD